MRHLRVIVYLIIIILINLPIFSTFVLSFQSPVQISSPGLNFIFKPTMQNFIEIFYSTKLNYLRFLTNSFSLSFIGSLMSIFLALPAAYGIVRFNIGRSFLLPFVVNIRVIPLIIFAIPFYFMFKFFHLFDSVIGLSLISCLINLPISLIIFTGFFQDMPIELEESASIDGATILQVLCKIILPLSKTVIASIFMLSFVYSWNEFLFGLILTTRKAVPVTVGATYFITSYGIKWGQTAAAILLSILPPIFVGIFSFRYLTKALLAGAIKG